MWLIPGTTYRWIYQKYCSILKELNHTYQLNDLDRFTEIVEPILRECLLSKLQQRLQLTDDQLQAFLAKIVEFKACISGGFLFEILYPERVSDDIDLYVYYQQYTFRKYIRENLKWPEKSNEIDHGIYEVEIGSPIHSVHDYTVANNDKALQFISTNIDAFKYIDLWCDLNILKSVFDGNIKDLLLQQIKITEIFHTWKEPLQMLIRLTKYTRNLPFKVYIKNNGLIPCNLGWPTLDELSGEYVYDAGDCKMKHCVRGMQEKAHQAYHHQNKSLCDKQHCGRYPYARIETNHHLVELASKLRLLREISLEKYCDHPLTAPRSQAVKALKHNFDCMADYSRVPYVIDKSETYEMVPRKGI
jgi:hypothetical protein